MNDAAIAEAEARESRHAVTDRRGLLDTIAALKDERNALAMCLLAIAEEHERIGLATRACAEMRAALLAAGFVPGVG